jgi:hypothetical protein
LVSSVRVEDVSSKEPDCPDENGDEKDVVGLLGTTGTESVIDKNWFPVIVPAIFVDWRLVADNPFACVIDGARSAWELATVEPEQR